MKKKKYQVRRTRECNKTKADDFISSSNDINEAYQSFAKREFLQISTGKCARTSACLQYNSKARCQAIYQVVESK